MTSPRGLLPLRLGLGNRPISTASSMMDGSLPPTPSEVGDAEILQVHHLQVRDGALRTERPTPSPPFRLLPPRASVVPSPRPPSPAQPQPAAPTPPTPQPAVQSPQPRPPLPPAIPSFVYSEAPSPPRTAPLSEAPFPRRPAPTNLDGMALAELRSRPLTQSAYGQRIVSLLCYPWVTAPSAIACVVFPPGADPEELEAIAEHINWLVCGAEAFVEPSAGVLGVRNLHNLNLLFSRAGLSPIAPNPVPDGWPVLAARNPPEFVLPTFRSRVPSMAHLSSYEGDS